MSVHRDVAKSTARGVTGPEPVEEWLLHVVLSGAAVGSMEIDALDDNDHRRDDLSVETSNRPKPALLPSSPPRRWIKPLLADFHPERFARGVRSSVDVTALCAGVFQVHDFLDESHQLSQSIEGAGTHHNGDYWHAIMHRREPDYPNSKYWLRHVGRHPVFAELSHVVAQRMSVLRQRAEGRDEELLARMSQLVDGRANWDAFAFVDFCRVCGERKRSDWTAVAEDLQWAEMLLLLKATLDDALVVE